MPSSEICRRVALVGMNVSKKLITSIIMVKKINKVGVALAVMFQL
jgi:hypothetical protein